MGRTRVPSVKRGGGFSTKILGPDGKPQKDRAGKIKRGYVPGPGDIWVPRSPTNPLHDAFRQFAEMFKGNFRHRENTGDPWVAGRLPYIDKMCDWVGITREQYCNTASRAVETRPFIIFLFALACRRKTHYHPNSVLELSSDTEELNERTRARQVENDKARALEAVFVSELHRRLTERRLVIRLLTQIAERTSNIRQLEGRLIYFLLLFADAQWPEFNPIPLRVAPMVDNLDPDVVAALIKRAHLVQGDEMVEWAAREEERDAWLGERDAHRLQKLRIKGGDHAGAPEG